MAITDHFHDDSGRLYYRGACSFTMPLPTVRGRYVYSLLVSPASKEQIVRTVQIDPPNLPPVISGYTADRSVPEGTSLWLTCTVTGGNPVVASVTFYCGDHADGTETTEAPAVGQSSVTSVVNFDPFTAEDDGVTCVCTADWTPRPQSYTHRSEVTLTMLPETDFEEHINVIYGMDEASAANPHSVPSPKPVAVAWKVSSQNKTTEEHDDDGPSYQAISDTRREPPHCADADYTTVAENQADANGSQDVYAAVDKTAKKNRPQTLAVSPSTSQHGDVYAQVNKGPKARHSATGSARQTQENRGPEHVNADSRKAKPTVKPKRTSKRKSADADGGARSSARGVRYNYENVGAFSPEHPSSPTINEVEMTQTPTTDDEYNTLMISGRQPSESDKGLNAEYNPGTPDPSSCSVRINATTWTVNGYCRIPKIYRSTGAYSCSWHQTHNGETTNDTLPMAITSSYYYSGRLYFRGVCSFAKPLPIVDGSYDYSLLVSPGTQEHHVGNVRIEHPGPPQLAGCPYYTIEGSDLRCTCVPSETRPGKPVATVWWPGYSNTRELVVRNVRREDGNSVYTCQLAWGPHAPQTVDYTLRVA
ncbi:hypothetical protein BaRGS_00011293, partial [Batillaria attramentaria]